VGEGLKIKSSRSNGSCDPPTVEQIDPVTPSKIKLAVPLRRTVGNVIGLLFQTLLSRCNGLFGTDVTCRGPVYCRQVLGVAKGGGWN
jgi:hypothetical protein